MNSMQYIQSLLDLEPDFVRDEDEETATERSGELGAIRRYSAGTRGSGNGEGKGDSDALTKTGHKEEGLP